jgi:hypothetical protein
MVLRELEAALSNASRKADVGQEAKSPQEEETLTASILGDRHGGLELDSSLWICAADERFVEVAIAACLDGALPGDGKVAPKPEAESLGSKLLASQANPFHQIFPWHTKLDSLFAPPAKRQVEMGMGGIEVRDSHPAEANSEIPLHGRHEFAPMFAEVEPLAGFR